jgi:hypothetical protein
MLNDLLLLSGNDIPFPEAQVVIHNPKVKEIALIGEEDFYGGCGVLNFSKENLIEEDRINLANINDFEILMMIMDNRNPEMRKNRINALKVLTLMFPEYQIELTREAIKLKKEEEICSINKDNFHVFKENLVAMFCLKGRGSEDEPEYNPGGKIAREIAEKIHKRRQVIAEQQGEQKIAILSRYSSILSVGLRLDLNTVLDYTVYQLFDQYERFELEEQFDIHLRAQLAGARDLKEVDNWKKDIHP